MPLKENLLCDNDKIITLFFVSNNFHKGEIGIKLYKIVQL